MFVRNLSAAWKARPPLAFFTHAVRLEVAARLRLVLVCACVLLLLQAWRGDVLWGRYRPLAAALQSYGLSVEDSETHHIATQRQGDGSQQTVIFRAREPNNLPDIWIANAILARDGQVARLSSLHNLTRTSSADEETPAVLGHWALCARRIEGEYVGLELFDLSAEPPPSGGGFTKLQRGITNLQQTGRFRGIGRRSYTFVRHAKNLVIREETARYSVQIDGVRLLIDPKLERPVEGGEFVEVRARTAAVTALVPWMVDTAREVSWIGPERIAWLENRAFALRDRVMQLYHSVTPVDQAEEAAEELGIAKATSSVQEEQKVERLAISDSDSGWPPPALAPIVTPELAGEGRWRAIVDDPDARVLPQGKPVFYQSFLRADPERSWARIYLTLWDPRLVQLHIVAGTQEPISATGETGRGTIPRTKAVMESLVGAFNGGFQAVHGEFGMMASGRVYLPPKPWAATVAVFDDGRVGMGSWPGPNDRKAGYNEARAVAEIPADMIAYRQNLTSIVEGDRFNPWGRWWWGAAPQQKSEQTLTQRSALCMTREGFMVYAWGDSASPEALGAALLSARCVRAMHLDMNAGHSGFEFYNVLPPDQARLSSEKRPSFRYEGSLAELPGYVIRARKGVTSMGMPLPRYIHPDPRDYFYLTLKPGIETTAQPPAGAPFSSADLPHAGWPPALARRTEAVGRVLRLDPSRALPYAGPPDGHVVLAELHGKPADAAAIDDLALYAIKQEIGVGYAVGVAPEGATVFLRGPALDSAPHARAALGVDIHGLWVYAEVDARASAGKLAQLMRDAEVGAAIALAAGVRLGLRFPEGLLAVDGATRLRDGGPMLTFVAQTKPAVEVLFPDTKPMPYARWAQLQDQRVRYFRTSEPGTKAPPGALRD